MSVDPGSRGWNEHRHADPIWVDFTPTFQQGVALTLTVNRARWVRIGRTITMHVVVTFTASGTAGQPVYMGVPTLLNAAANGIDFVIGTYMYRKIAGPVVYAMGAVWADMSFVPDGSSGGLLGQYPAGFQVVSGDQLGLTVTYEAALP